MIAVPYQSDTLNCADYMFMDRDYQLIGIERCETGNFVEKLRSGELEKQMERCTATYQTTVLLLEGVYGATGDGLLATYRNHTKGYFMSHIYPFTRMDTIMAAIIRMSEYGIEILQTPSLEISATLIRLIHNQRTEAEELATLFKKIRAIRMPVKYTKDPAVPRLMALCPRLGEKVAISLISKYNSIWEVLHQTDTELLQTEGFGKGLLESFKKATGKV
jgi:ERCC4-type nuclease